MPFEVICKLLNLSDRSKPLPHAGLNKMMWDQFFLTRLAIAYFLIFTCWVWLFTNCEQLAFLQYHHIFYVKVLLVIHSVGLAALSAGLFGYRFVAFIVTFLVGMIFFGTVGLIVWGSLSRPFVFSVMSFWEISSVVLLGCSGLILLFLTYLLVRSSLTPPDHFRSDF